MEAQWIYFHRSNDRENVGILLDLQAQRELDQASRPFLLTFAVNVYHVAETKGQAEQVRTALVKLEDELQARLKRAGAGTYVGRIDSQTKVEYFYYVRDEASADEALNDVKTEDVQLRTRYHVREDAEHSFYRTYLYPSPREKLHARNSALLHGLRAEGYKTGHEQRIHYWLRFLDKRGYEEGKRELGEQGYRIEGVQSDRPGGGDYGYLLHVSRIGTLEIAALNEVTDGLHELATTRGGTYEGWGLHPRQNASRKLRLLSRRMLYVLGFLVFLAAVIAIGAMLFGSSAGKPSLVERLTGADAADRPIAVGKKAPAATATDFAGRAYTVGGKREKPQVVHFCDAIFEPCQRDWLELESLAGQYAGRADFLAVGLGSTPRDVHTMLKEHPPTFPVVYAVKVDLYRLYKIKRFPAAVFIDTGGIVRGVYGALDEEERAAIAELLR